jgi:hypothetical protein
MRTSEPREESWGLPVWPAFLLLVLWLAVTVSANAGTAGVCARVGLRLDQSAVITRTAFRATLELSNHDPASPLRSVGLQVRVRDLAGQDATPRFFIEPPALENIDRVDGNGDLAAKCH